MKNAEFLRQIYNFGGINPGNESLIVSPKAQFSGL